RKLRCVRPSHIEQTEELLYLLQIGLIPAPHEEFHGHHARNREGVFMKSIQPRLCRGGTSKALDQNVGIDENHQAERFQPWDRKSRANSKLSAISVRFRHIPKNSESAKLPNVAGAEAAE